MPSNINNVLLFPRNIFHECHPEEYRWSQSGPREISMVPRGSAELCGNSKRSRGSQKVPEVPTVLMDHRGSWRGPKGPSGFGNPRESRGFWKPQEPKGSQESRMSQRVPGV